MEASPGLLVVFTRLPEPGAVKTRLVPALGPAGAAGLHREMAERTLRRVSPGGARVEVRCAGCDAARARAWLGTGVACREQGPGDLGERLHRGFEEGFAAGAPAVAAVGTDCPELGAGDVRDAFAALGRADCVLGPAEDGGYWIVGLRRPAWDAGAAAIFAGIPWGSGGVLEATLAAARAARLSCELLRTLPDVDRPGDLPAWELAAAADAAGDGGLSVVVPALDEAGRIGDLVGRLRAEAGVGEVVVADGGSADGTVAEALRRGARVVVAGRGRGRQMNAGAAAATGGILLFLHADTTPPPGFPALVSAALALPGVAAGAFAFATDSPRRSLRVIERGANLRARLLGVVFGDQGLFVRRGAFTRAGGFPDQPILEDLALVRRLRRLGRVALLPQAAVTSARRWHERGVVRTTALNAAVTAGALLGVPPARLDRWYRGRAGR